MPITVTMLQTRQGEGGVLWTAGNSYSASDSFGAYLITSNLATGTIPLPAATSLSPAQATAIAALVSEAGNITTDDLATTTGTLGQTVRLIDGENKGAILMWSTPAGSSTAAWCWWLWPQAAY